MRTLMARTPCTSSTVTLGRLRTLLGRAPGSRQSAVRGDTSRPLIGLGNWQGVARFLEITFCNRNTPR